MKLVDSACISLSVLILGCGGGESPPPASGNVTAASTTANVATGSGTTGTMLTTSSSIAGSSTGSSSAASGTAVGGGMTAAGSTSSGGMTNGAGATTSGGGASSAASTTTGGTLSSTSGGLDGAGGSNSTGAGGSTATTGIGGNIGSTGGGSDALTAVATITPTTAAPAGWEGFSATATFTQEGDMVTLVIEASGCSDGLHISHLHAEVACGADGEAAGAHWIPNGEVLEDMTCASGMGTYTHSESTEVWSIGGDPGTDITLHSYMVHALSSAAGAGAKAACGSIVAQ